MSRSEAVIKGHATRHKRYVSTWIHENGIVKVPLGKTGLFAIIDEIDFAAVSQYAWLPYRSRGSLTLYAWANGKGPRPVKKVILHRLILSPRDSEKVDHIDRNGLNCVRSNLRIATDSQNAANVKRRNSGPFRGITRRKEKWIAQIQVSNKQLHIGLFPNPELAARAYNEAALKYFGEFAVLNKIESAEDGK